MEVKLRQRGGEKGMKKTLSTKALAKEAAFWDSLKQSARDHPGKICHK